MSQEEKEARRILESSALTLVMTGAGVSADSGISTFRGTDGYWRNKHFSELACQEGFNKSPREVWDWYLERRRTCKKAQPNDAHRALATWMEHHPAVLVTQNVDGLHERASTGIVIRLHGSLWEVKCSQCDRSRADDALEYQKLPTCSRCQTLERPGVVWFGESLPVRAMAAARLAARKCDAMLVIGTSALVHPAAGFIDQAREAGAKIIEINPEPVLKDADFTFAMKAGEIVPRLLSLC